jgi:fatty-acyl-CoA synthase
MQPSPFVLREITLGDLLDETIARWPDGEAVVHYERDFRQTWSELGRSSDTLAKGLMALGIRPGEKVAIWATNIPHWITLMFAAARIGAVMVTVNASYQAKELEYLLRQSQCENLFMSDGYRDHSFSAILRGIIPDLESLDALDLRLDSLPRLRRVLLMDDTRIGGLPCLTDIMALAPRVSDEEYEARKALVKPGDMVNMQYTSGTTGFPKGVMLNHLSIINDACQVGRNQRLGPSDRLCLMVPLFHCFGCVLGVIGSACHGVCIVVIEAFNTRQVLGAIQQERCSVLYGVPSMFLSILEHRQFSEYDLSSLRTGIMSGAPCPAPLLRRVEDRMHMKELTVCWGQTEASPVATHTLADGNFERKISSAGKAMPGLEVIVADLKALPENVIEAPRGRKGEILIRGYAVMLGYYNMPEETAASITPDGWLRSGDMGVMDEDGYLTITGRIKEMIIRGGENIYPREIEEFLRSMPGVLDVQVVGVPSRTYGEEVVAFLIPEQGAALRGQDVRAYCKGKIAWHKVPRYVAIVESFPMTASGKVQKFKLSRLASKLFPEAVAKYTSASPSAPVPCAVRGTRPARRDRRRGRAAILILMKPI